MTDSGSDSDIQRQIFDSLTLCEKCNSRSEPIALNEPHLDEEGEFYIHSVKLKCKNKKCGYIHNFAYQFEKTQRYFENIKKELRN